MGAADGGNEDEEQLKSVSYHIDEQRLQRREPEAVDDYGAELDTRWFRRLTLSIPHAISSYRD